MSGSSRQARLGAKTTVAHCLSTKPAAQTPTASTSTGADQRADELTDGVHDLGGSFGRRDGPVTGNEVAVLVHERG